MKYKAFLGAVTAMGLAFASMTAQAMHHGNGDGSGNKGKMFEKLDADGDGTISKFEFLEYHTQKFQKMDADGDGVVSQDEARAFQSDRKEAMKKKWQEKKQMRMEKRNDDNSSDESTE